MFTGNILHGRTTVPGETCAICGATVPFSITVHLLIHTRSEQGVIDRYVCRPCYEERVEGLFEAQTSEQ